MANEQDQSSRPVAAKTATGNAWGDPIGEARQHELEQILRTWEKGQDRPERRGPFVGMRLTGADVFWTAARVSSEFWRAKYHPDDELTAEKIAHEADILKRVSKERDDISMYRVVGGDSVANHRLPESLSTLHLENADLTGAHLERAILVRAHLDGTRLDKAHLEKADLRTTGLNGASLRWAYLGDAEFHDADLRRATLGSAQLDGTDFRGANLDDADLSGAQLDRTDFRAASLVGTNFYGTELERAFFTIAQLKSQGLRQAGLRADSRERLIEAAKLFEEHYEAHMRARRAAEDQGVRFAMADPDKPDLPVDSPIAQVACSAYYPKEVATGAWTAMFVYLSLDRAETLTALAANAAQRIRGQKEPFRGATAQGSAPIPHGTQLILVPALPGFTINPATLTVMWEEDVQCHEFRVRADTAPVEHAANGSVRVWVGPLLFAEVPLSIFVLGPGQHTDLSANVARMVTRAYRKIFASYSHRDSRIVALYEATVQKLGDRYLRDVSVLRSGEVWNERLLQAINDADIFQLFWSEEAAKSRYVEQEWRYALGLVATHPEFIRPLYWTETPYPPPPELSRLHFERLDLAQVAALQASSLWHRLFGRRVRQ